MTDSDDRIARRYRELAREEPPPALDAAILARARQATGDGPSFPAPEETRVRPRFPRWAGPMSIAAVLVLGIGVSLRMQLEQPGIETSAPAIEPSQASEYSMPPGAESAPAPAPAVAADAARPATAPKAARQNRPDTAPVPKPFADAPIHERSRSENATSQAIPAAPPASAFAPSPQPALDSLQAAPAQPPAAVRAQEAPAAAQSAPLRAKREVALPDSAGARELRKSLAPETDPDRELERIARLREAGSHAQADAALAEFRRRRPDYRIPEGMWERVKPR